MKFRYIAAAAVIGIVAWAVNYYAPHTIRYRFSVEVDTPAGVRTGSSVIEAQVKRRLPLWGTSSRYFAFRGEAPVIDLPNGIAAFAILGEPEYFVSLTFNALSRAQSDARLPLPKAGEWYGDNWTELQRTRPLVVLASQDYPRFVWFHDIADPNSAEEIMTGNFTSAFGPDYSLRRVTFQPTDEPISDTIERRLPWLKQPLSEPFSGFKISSWLERRLGKRSFRWMGQQ